MPAYGDLGAHFAELSDDELVDELLDGRLTDEASERARDELRSRRIDVDAALAKARATTDASEFEGRTVPLTASGTPIFGPVDAPTVTTLLPDPEPSGVLSAPTGDPLLARAAAAGPAPDDIQVQALPAGVPLRALQLFGDPASGDAHALQRNDPLPFGSPTVAAPMNAALRNANASPGAVSENRRLLWFFVAPLASAIAILSFWIAIKSLGRGVVDRFSIFAGTVAQASNPEGFWLHAMLWMLAGAVSGVIAIRAWRLAFHGRTH